MTKRTKKTDDLSRIGIGSHHLRILSNNGVNSFSALARCSIQRLEKILGKVRGADPATWKSRAALARDGKWNQLQPATQSPTAKETTGRSTATVVFAGVGGTTYASQQPFVIERILTDQEADQEYLARKQELDIDIAKAKLAINKLMAKYDPTSKGSSGKADFTSKFHKMIRDGKITGVSARFRTKFGQPVSPLSVVIAVNVKRKLPADQLPKRSILPRELDGIRIKVLEGSFYHLTAPSGSFLRGAALPESPLPFTAAILGGIPIAPATSQADFGTLGILSKQGTSTVGLTCQHVVKGDSGDVMLQLGPGRVVRDAFTVEKVVQPDDRNILVNGIRESVDCAYVKVKSDGTAILLPSDGVWIQKISTPTAKVAPLVFGNRDLLSTDSSLPLWKFGNGSGEKIQGKIGMLRHDRIFIDSLDYQNNFTVSRQDDSGRSFAFPGDSGSVLVVEAQAQIDGGPRKNCFVAIGILFAALSDSTKGVACTMVRVLKGLGITGQVPTVSDWFPR